MKAYHPDDTGMRPREVRDPKQDRPANNGGGTGGGNRMMPAFMPGQKGALAEQLNAGFGGGLKAWRGNIGATYSPFRNATMFPYANLGPASEKPSPSVQTSALTDGRPTMTREEWQRMNGGRA